MAKTKADLTDREFAQATARGVETRETGLLAKSARYDVAGKRVLIELSSGFSIGVPIAALPELRNASAETLGDVEVLGAGGILHWEALDADYSIPALVLSAIGRSTATRELARIAGSSTSDAKAAAARANGAKGGRPRKHSTRSRGAARKTRDDQVAAKHDEVGIKRVAEKGHGVTKGYVVKKGHGRG